LSLRHHRDRLVGRAMRRCFTCRGAKYDRRSCSARTRGLRAAPSTRQCWESDGLKDDANRALRRNMGRGSTLDRPLGARLRRQAPDPEYRQRLQSANRPHNCAAVVPCSRRTRPWLRPVDARPLHDAPLWVGAPRNGSKAALTGRDPGETAVSALMTSIALIDAYPPAGSDGGPIVISQPSG
jgi:hypothetical protein